jgi:hypothetical protein
MNPLVAYQAWGAATLGISTTWTAFSYAATGYVPFGPRNIALANVARGHAVMVVGVCAMYIGMKVSRPSERLAQRGALVPPSAGLLTFAGALGAAAYLFREPLTEAVGSTITNFIGAFPLAITCLALITPPTAVRGVPGAKATLAIGSTLMLLLLYAHRDSKMDIMFGFFPLLWLLLLRRVSWWILAPVGTMLCLVYLLFVAPLVTTARNQASAHQATTLQVWSDWVAADILPLLTESVVNNADLLLSDWSEKTVSRLCDPCAAGAIIEITDQQGLEWGRTMNYVLVGFVPRMFWKAKPNLDRGREFTAELGIASSAETAHTSTGQTSPGELYRNFGWIGVILGMLVLGLGIGGFWWGAAGPDPRVGIFEMTAYTGAMLSFILASGSAAGAILLGCVFSGLLCRIGIYLRDYIFTRSKRSRHQADRGTSLGAPTRSRDPQYRAIVR